jgi:hypothetical protein
VESGGGTIVCLDYSKYDSTIPAVFIREAFRILSTWFEESDLNEFGWSTIVNYFINTPIVMPDGHLYVGKNHGVPSGSYFTQLIDSVVNVALMYAYSHKFGFRFDPLSLFVLGDDSIVRVKGQFSLSDWAAYANSLGMSIHDDEKTVVGEAHFLGATWKKGKPDTDLQKLINNGAFPEAHRSYEGQPHRGAEHVVRSYAATYKSGWKLIPESQFHNFRLVDRPNEVWTIENEFLTGSDKLLFDEMERRGIIRMNQAVSLVERFSM